jgi:hypothetical protein
VRTYSLSESDDMPRVDGEGKNTVLRFIHQNVGTQPVFLPGEVVTFTRPWNAPLTMKIVSHTSVPQYRDILHTVIGV